MKKILFALYFYLGFINFAFCGKCLPILASDIDYNSISSYVLLENTGSNAGTFVFCGTHHDKNGHDDNKGCDIDDVVWTPLKVTAQICNARGEWKDFYVNTKCGDDLQTVINTHNRARYNCATGFDERSICYGNEREGWAIQKDTICKYDYDKFDSLDRECFLSGGTAPWSEGPFCRCEVEINLINDGPYKCKCIDDKKRYDHDLHQCITYSANLLNNDNLLNGTECDNPNKEIKNGKCEWTAKYVAGLENDLDSKFNGLTATIGGFEKNVWRDENGEFNTARLASDSIAGVVLGTVGGIVTANLVKKAQVKQGFEDIGCYIGGQSVAGYGDEFNVGR